ncbi:AAA family ATPase [Rhizobium cremeum]|uniref:AAA family ATPase n=1 Tax=Rhizobium cremeum TaxID=2813827 RepID=UPI001FD38023
MWIESIRIEGGTLNGFRQSLRPGLNVLIGGRGTGKSSVIELIRFCMGAPSSSDVIGKEALEHALGVLGDGKVVLTLRNGSDRIEVARIATDGDDNRPLEVSPPLVFSQKEVEQIGGRSQSRLRLIDGFIAGRSAAAAKRGPLHARINSASIEIRSLLVEVADIAEKLQALPKLQERLAELQGQGAAQRARSAELDGLRKQLDELTPLVSAASVRAGSIGRSVDHLGQWTDDLDLVVGRQPSIELWPAQAMAPDQLQPHRKRLQTAHARLSTVIAEYRSVIDDLELLRQKSTDEKSVLEAKSREIRQKIEEQQKGASVLDRQIADLSQQIAALQALADLRTERLAQIDRLHAQRQAALDEMHAHNVALTAGRQQIAARLTAGLAPSIRVTVKPLATTARM